MIKKIKIGFQLLKYQHNFKKDVCLSIILLIAGIFFCLDTAMNSCIIGMAFLGSSGMFLFSSVTSVYCTELFMSSPKRRFFEIKSFAIGNTVINLIGFTICIGVKIFEMIFWKVQPDRLFHKGEQVMMIQNQIFLAGIMTTVMSIYIAVAYKYFISSVIVVYILFFIILDIGNLEDFTFAINGCSITTTVFVTYLMVFSGCVLAYFLTCLCYKKKMSVLGQPADLRKYL